MTEEIDAPSWTDGGGPLRFLPSAIFRDARPLVAILIAWVLSFGGSAVLGFLVTRLVPTGAGPDFGDAPAWFLLVGIAIVSPIVETLLMAGWLALLLRWLRPWQAVVASAATWGVLHSLIAPLWGAVIWWPFLIFSIVYVSWRHRGFWIAVGMVSTIHILQNAAPAVATVLGY